MLSEFERSKKDGTNFSMFQEMITYINKDIRDRFQDFDYLKAKLNLLDPR